MSPDTAVVVVKRYGDERLSAIEQGILVWAYSCLYQPFETEELNTIIPDLSQRKRNILLGESFFCGAT